MPELPEVEVTAQSLAAQLTGRPLMDWCASAKRLRHPLPAKAIARLMACPLIRVGRRAKYVLMEFASGWLAVHLGMSGTLQVFRGPRRLGLHDHLGLSFGPTADPLTLVFHDPRRFGSVQFIARASVDADIGDALGATAQGIEPLSDAFNGPTLTQLSKNVRSEIKPWLMAGKAVVGVGNIYASEALFRAGIHPRRRAGRIAAHRMELLAQEIRTVLKHAIDAGGSSLRDFHSADGAEGRYGKEHLVYDREGLPCVRCASPLCRIVQAQRSSFYCRVCQK